MSLIPVVFFSSAHSYEKFFRTSNGKLLCFGYNDCGQLGLDSRSAVNSPISLPFEIPSEDEIIHVAMGWGHVILCTKIGKVFGIGKNCFGQLSIGRGKSHFSIETPTRCILPKNIPFTRSYCGYEHTLFVSEKGSDVFGAGKNAVKQLGAKDPSHPTYVAKRTELPKYEVIDYIEAGNSFTFFVCKSKRIYKSGCVYNEKICNSPIVAIDTSKYFHGNVIQLRAGVRHAIVITDSKLCYVIGYNSFGQLGVKKRKVLHWTLLKDLSFAKAKQISCGFHHTFVLTEKNGLYGSGCNDDGQLGLNIDTHVKKFTKIQIDNVDHVVGCARSSFLIKKNGEFFFTGRNERSEFGNGNNENSKVFTKNPLIKNVKEQCYLKDFFRVKVFKMIEKGKFIDICIKHI